ncbi:helix-turn-helix transcriptional regulator, partial [Lysobacter sp. D1-1-M9]|uniref:helix-turn-helix domain-containing protein n=1 Tax=Novilysobacter longmucuonensis TaxID=3098603 RepID=UPI002FCA4B82
KTEAQKLRDELARKDADLARAKERTADLARERDQVAKAHRKMRRRVMNGVCPCCNRSFQNLREHMQTKHADFGKEQTLKALREAFGMTQGDVADEAFVKPPYVSLYERGKPVPAEARERLDWWLESQSARA